jgi:predicted component of viral defense system (DUF524 family)
VPDVLTLTTPHFNLTVWSKEINKSQARLAKTLKARSPGLMAHQSLRFQPALTLTLCLPVIVDMSLPASALQELNFPEVLFFENKLYEFDFQFSAEVETRIEAQQPSFLHRSSAVTECFHFSRNCLRGAVNFGNDVGWFRLGLRYFVQGQERTQYLSFEVLPTKMAMAQDLPLIHQAIDATYPLWRFSFIQKTEQELASSNKPHERFELLWLAHFERLRERLEKGIKTICHAPHTRLLPQVRQLRAERLHGRLTPKLEERVTQHRLAEETQHRYRVEMQQLSLDTPENRFIKMVLLRSSSDIAQFIGRLKENYLAPDKERVSLAFLDKISAWKKPLDQLLNQAMFAEVGDFHGLQGESLVLQQRAGYASVYRIWQELKLYLDLFGGQSNIAMKSVAELYEVWCFIEIKNILLKLDFKLTSISAATLTRKGIEKSFIPGKAAAFEMEKGDIKIRLVHEPSFGKPSDLAHGKIYSWLTTQRPDIFLEASFKNGDKLHWIFDAKYRIKSEKESTDFSESVDYIPEDAINQMHRYRDAIIHIENDQQFSDSQNKSRPVIGAFVLYPGWFDEAAFGNPYEEAIKAVGIGGFPLLPGQPNLWLEKFLQDNFGAAIIDPGIPGNYPEYSARAADEYLIQDSARISTTGTYLERYRDLTLIASLGNGREPGYLQGFNDGKAAWYHMPLSTTESKSVLRSVMKELRHLVIAVSAAESTGRILKTMYDIKSVNLVNRAAIGQDRAGAACQLGKETAEYWLFELEHARALKSVIEVPASEHPPERFLFQFSGATELKKASNWSELSRRYAGIR